MFRAKRALDLDSRFVEIVADRLSTRMESHGEGLAPEVLERFDSAENRTNYLLMQEELCDLNLVERRNLGRMHRDLSGTIIPVSGVTLI